MVQRYRAASSAAALDCAWYSATDKPAVKARTWAMRWHNIAGERRRYLVGILAARHACGGHRDHGRDGPDPRRGVGDRFPVQHGRPAR